MRAARIILLSSFTLWSTSAMAGMIDKEGLAPYEVCGLCHSLDGVSKMAKFPKLAGQPASYLKKQILDFMEGKRTNDGGQMAAIVTEIEPGTIDEIANWFASQKVPPPEVSTEKDLAAGEALFKSSQCDTCHEGAVKQGSQVPLLTAQHEAYLKKQMRDFRDGDRTNFDAHPLQNTANSISNDEIDLLAAYLASKVR